MYGLVGTALFTGLAQCIKSRPAAFQALRYSSNSVTLYEYHILNLSSVPQPVQTVA